jgi:hypothetical protein
MYYRLTNTEVDIAIVDYFCTSGDCDYRFTTKCLFSGCDDGGIILGGAACTDDRVQPRKGMGNTFCSSRTSLVIVYCWMQPPLNEE